VRSGGDPATEIAAVEFSTGKVLWKQAADEFLHGYVTEAGGVVVLLTRGHGAILARIDGHGVERDSEQAVGDDTTLWVDQSTSSLAVLGHGGPFPGSVGADGAVAADVFDLTAWALRPGAIHLDIDGQP